MENRASGLDRSQILALDLGAVTGYYSAHGHGSWNFHPARGRNGMKTYLAFYIVLKEYIKQNGIRKIVTEEINFNVHNNDYRKLNELRGIVRLLTEELGLLPVEFTSVRVLKKWATGSGNATKEEMIAACVNRYRFRPRDDHQADACHLYFHFLRKWRVP
jgi:Holliday junction resolvasome RuvABC endonuclease subunit